jgi:hypothetical protein
MKSKNLYILGLFALLLIPSLPLITRKSSPIATELLYDELFSPYTLHTSDYEQYSNGNFSDFKCSNYSLSVFLSESTATIAGNLTVDFYNNDPVSFTQLPFHLYTSGMEFVSQQGFIEIINVTTLTPSKEQLPFVVLSDQQLMWVNLSSNLDPDQRTSFCISFNTTLPDGGIDRANVYGDDGNHTKIFKFASSYPIPCVYDAQGW